MTACHWTHRAIESQLLTRDALRLSREMSARPGDVISVPVGGVAFTLQVFCDGNSVYNKGNFWHCPIYHSHTTVSCHSFAKRRTTRRDGRRWMMSDRIVPLCSIVVVVSCIMGRYCVRPHYFFYFFPLLSYIMNVNWYVCTWNVPNVRNQRWLIDWFISLEVVCIQCFCRVPCVSPSVDVDPNSSIRKVHTTRIPVGTPSCRYSSRVIATYSTCHLITRVDRFQDQNQTMRDCRQACIPIGNKNAKFERWSDKWRIFMFYAQCNYCEVNI